MKYDDRAAYFAIQPYYDMLRQTLPEAERGPCWHDMPKVASPNSYVHWCTYADRLDNMVDMAESYGVQAPMRWLAGDWLIEIGTVNDERDMP